MKVQEMPGRSTIADLLERILEEDSLSTASGESFWEDGEFKINHKETYDIHQKLHMGDLVEFVPRKSLDDYREKLMRMYDSCSIQNARKSRPKSTVRQSKIAVF